MKRIIFIAFLVVLFQSCGSVSDVSYLEVLTDVKKNSIKKDIKSITVFGYGHPIQQIFFENFTKELLPSLQNKQIELSSVFVKMKNGESFSKLLPEIDKIKTDGILFLKPDSNIYVMDFSNDNLFYYNTKTSVTNHMHFKFYDKSNLKTAVFQVDLNRSYIINKPSTYKKLAKAIVLKFEENLIFLKE